MSMREKLVTNATFLSLNWVAITILPVFFWFIVGKMLPPESYGIIATALQVTVFMSFIASFGFPMVLDKLIPELLEKHEEDKIQGVINHTFSVTMAMIVVISVATFFLIPYLSSFLKLEQEIIWIIIVLFVVNTAGNYFKNIYFGYQNMKKIFTTNALGQIARVIVTFVLIYAGFSHFGALIGLFVSFTVILITRLDRKVFHISEKAIVDKKMIYSYAIPSLMYLILVQVYGNTQNILLSSMTTVEISGLFGIAMTMSSLISTIPQIVTSSIFPVLSGLSADKRAKQKQSYLLKIVFRYSLLIALPVALAVTVFSDYVILFVSSIEYMPATAFLIYLVPAAILNSIGGLFLSSLYAIGEPKQRTIAWAIIAIVYLPLTIFMIQNFSAEGLSISYFSVSVLLFFVSFYFIKQSLSFKLPIKDTTKIILSLIIPFLIMYYSKQLLVLPIGDIGMVEFLLEYVKVGIVVSAALAVYGLSILFSNSLIQEDMDVMDTVAKTSPILRNEINLVKDILSKYAKRSYRN